MKLKIRETYSSSNNIYYKNVDICDLPSIMSKGILSLDASGNDNWDFGKRANNATDVVYLFRPTGYENSFVNYGVALLEVEVDGVENEMLERDVNKGKYIEYICDCVPPENIRAIYIPKIFKDRVSYRHPKIKWVDMEAKMFSYEFNNSYDKRDNYIDCSKEMLQLFADTTKVNDSTAYMYFRGILPNGDVFDLYYIHYDI